MLKGSAFRHFWEAQSSCLSLAVDLPNGYTEGTKHWLGKTRGEERRASLQGEACMPKVADYRLAWSVTEQTYQVQNTREHALLDIVPESPAWFSWLEQASSFAFRGQGGHYTARKESRAHGQTYWYAYLGTGQQLTKKYLGKSREL